MESSSMIYLLITTLIWGFSFGIIKNSLAGVDTFFISLCRMLLSLLVFLPFLRMKKINSRLSIQLILTGAVQFGIMYICYIGSFQYLKAYEVALFTIFTPLYVSLLDGILSKQLNWIFLFTAFLAVAGTSIIAFKEIATPNLLIGFFLVQISNLAFALGQLFYRRFMKTSNGLEDQKGFGLLYLGGFIITGIASGIFTPWSKLQLGTPQILSLVYLGVIASGVGFFLWNLGARKVNVGTLAVTNNLKVPIAIAISLIFFGEKTDLARLLLGGAVIIAALIINELVTTKKPEIVSENQE
jgi:carboxylate/amino acid/amine transporter